MNEFALFAISLAAVVALGFVACGCGLTGRRRLGVNTVFALPIAMVLTVILDMDRPRRGLIRVNQESLARLEATLEQAGR
jgi:hypothetical protein